MSRFDGASLFDWIFLFQNAITGKFKKKTIRPRNLRAQKQQFTGKSGKNIQITRNDRGVDTEKLLILRVKWAKSMILPVMLFENTAKNVSRSKGAGEQWSESAGRREQQHDKKDLLQR